MQSETTAGNEVNQAAESPGAEGEAPALSPIEEVEEEDEDFDPLDLERIEAEYRAARARAIFSAGAAARISKFELMRCLFCLSLELSMRVC